MISELELGYIAEGLRGLAVAVGELHEDAANARVDHAVDRIAASLRQYGQRKPVVANRAQGGQQVVQLVGGHLGFSLRVNLLGELVVGNVDEVVEGLGVGEGLAGFADRVVGLGRGFGVEVDGDLVDVGVVEQYLGGELGEGGGLQVAEGVVDHGWVSCRGGVGLPGATVPAGAAVVEAGDQAVGGVVGEVGDGEHYLVGGVADVDGVGGAASAGHGAGGDVPGAAVEGDCVAGDAAGYGLGGQVVVHDLHPTQNRPKANGQSSVF